MSEKCTYLSAEERAILQLRLSDGELLPKKLDHGKLEKPAVLGALGRGEEWPMKKTKFTELQIAFALRQAETGTQVKEICGKFSVSPATFYNWKKKYGGLGVSELRRLEQLVPDLCLLKEMLQEVIREKLQSPLRGVSWRTSSTTPVVSVQGMELVRVSLSYFCYQPHPRDDRAERARIREIAETRVCYGMWRIHTQLRREGRLINHKKKHRIFCEEGLNFRRKRPRRRVAAAHLV